MKCKILHEKEGRIRIHLDMKRMSASQADTLATVLASQEFVLSATVHERTANAVVNYIGDRGQVIDFFSKFQFTDEIMENTEVDTTLAINRHYRDKLVKKLFFRAFRRLFVPFVVRRVFSSIRALRYIFRGLRCLGRRQMRVEVLDAVSIGVSLIRGDFSTASSVMFLLGIGELLEEWTHKKSVNDLAKSMALNVDRVWLITQDNDEVLVSVKDVEENDLIHIRTGGLIPLDGVIVKGEAMINQASLTGESIPLAKKEGTTVYAGTVLEEGEITIRVTNSAGSGHYDKIVEMIEQSENLKSAVESKASRLADSLVPYSLGGTVLTYLLTGNVTKAVSILMVDFSCALKLAMPLAVLSAMKEAGKHHTTVKGGKFMEAIAEADTIVFDKTGTLTHATPVVQKVIPFGGNDENEMLRVAACLEEHYPHSIANAVTKKAFEMGLRHDEMHEELEYIVAHGIASKIDGRKVIIGSYHFVFEDEKCTIPPEEKEKFDNLPAEYSLLYIATAGVLSAVICILDPLREEAADVIRELKNLGITKTVMMTGDSENTARAIAAEVGVDEFHAEVLPADKAEYVRKEREEGRKVIMIGDGINDSPALSEADCGIAISDGAAIAREIADVTIGADDLGELVTLRRLSMLLMKRIKSNYRFVMGFNGSLIGLGLLGAVQPATSAFLHNASTIAISLKSMTNLEKNNR
ncbi:MAG: heavy metal translocating P-type ATPase [Lachnospiraceae bacterium]|nr:heavy metal translocating P-type ATPase [Lachnospiraceae bacterium]